MQICLCKNFLHEVFVVRTVMLSPSTELEEVLCGAKHDCTNTLESQKTLADHLHLHVNTSVGEAKLSKILDFPYKLARRLCTILDCGDVLQMRMKATGDFNTFKIPTLRLMENRFKKQKQSYKRN